MEELAADIDTREIERDLRRVVPSSMSLEDRLERIPGMIYQLQSEIHRISGELEETTRSIKTMEDKEFYRLKGAEKPGGGKYTEKEAAFVAPRNLKDSESYQDFKARERKLHDDLAEKKRLLDFYDRMERNAKYLLWGHGHGLLDDGPQD